ncbi:MAG: rod shape-determining protein MreD [Myxococcales bacterium]|nr:MAG: rod shape-determining protein MreD [Myxococcales bacterium]
MRSAAYLGVAVLLILIQSNLFRVLGPLGHVLGERLTNGLTPSLLLPMVVFLGVYEPNMAKGAALSSAMGYALDILAKAPTGIHGFVFVAIWWLSRVAGVRLTAQTWFTRASLGFVFTIVQGALVVILIAVFGTDNRRPVAMAAVVLPNAIATALLSPTLFQLAQRLRQGGASRAPTEGVG